MTEPLDGMSESEGEGEASRGRLNELLKERDGLPRRLFHVALENLAVFGVPAGLAVYVGIQTDRLLLALSVAFVLSWGIFIVRFRTILRKMNALERAIEAERKRLGIETPKPKGYEEEDGEEEEQKDLP